jgi:hypothetical protein
MTPAQLEAEHEALNAACPFDLMKFTLTYDGELPSAGNRNSRVREKWEIRKALHPQLKELWETSSVLLRLKNNATPGYADETKPGSDFVLAGTERSDFLSPTEKASIPQGASLKWRQLYPPIPVNGIEFMPLVRESLSLICGLDILFLRKEEPGKLILQGGDIDNRLKTLFDALKMPSMDDFNGSENNGEPSPNPFYCLLQSDALISDCAIKTDRLLTRPGSSNLEVRLVIAVTVRVLKVRSFNLPLLGD